MLAAASESIATEVVPVMLFTFTPFPLIATCPPSTEPVISARPPALIFTFPPLTTPAAETAPAESISTEVVPVIELCAPRFTVFASKSTSLPSSEPVI